MNVLTGKKEAKYTKGTFKDRKSNKNCPFRIKTVNVIEKHKENMTKKQTVCKIENRRLSNTNTSQKRNQLWWNKVLRNGSLLEIYMWHPSCCFCQYKSDDQSHSVMIRRDCGYDSQNVFGWHIYIMSINKLVISSVKLSRG